MIQIVISMLALFLIVITCFTCAIALCYTEAPNFDDDTQEHEPRYQFATMPTLEL